MSNLIPVDIVLATKSNITTAYHKVKIYIAFILSSK